VRVKRNNYTIGYVSDDGYFVPNTRYTENPCPEFIKELGLEIEGETPPPRVQKKRKAGSADSADPKPAADGED
jgi:hypothetical protein